jgi:myo-inositol 2-dehydrogenase / D-chiro-inositol 1-dehydrogenase
MSDLRIAVLGVGMMGADHVARITGKISGARVAVINDYLPEKAAEVAASVPGSRVAADPFDAITADDVDAVLLATPGPTHEKQLLACLEQGKPVLCEKPLTTDSASSLEVVRREAALGTPLIQVGFMRRFDPEYQQLKMLIDGGELGQPLVMHCAHRNPTVPPSFDSAMVVRDSLVHEVDVTRFLLGEEIVSVQIIKPMPNRGAPRGLQDPQIAIFRTASGKHVDVEVFVTTGIAYEVRTEVVGELGSATIGLDVGLVRKSAPGLWGGRITPGFRERFGTAYDIEVQRWVDAIRSGVNVDGPTAWDGYAAVAVCEAGVRSLETGEAVDVELAERVSVG